MGQPTWRKLTKVTVPGRAGTIWTPALDYVTPGRLYKLTVEPRAGAGAGAVAFDQTWKPEAGSDCTADGDLSITRTDPGVIDLCAAGALIAKVGGSSADLKPDKEKSALFAVGRHCVFSVAEPAKCGALYLGVNDAHASIMRIEGQLEVTIHEAL